MRGPEIVNNGGFDSEDDWTLSDATISEGELVVSSESPVAATAIQSGNSGIIDGTNLEVEIVVSEYNLGTGEDDGIAVILNGVSSDIITEAGTYTFTLSPTGAYPGQISIFMSTQEEGGGSCSISSVSVKSVLEDYQGSGLCHEKREKNTITLDLGKMKPDKKLSNYMKRAKRGR